MDLEGEDPRPAVTCLLHVPRSAGSSIYAALVKALPAGSVAPQRGDLAGFRIFSDFADFDGVDESVRLSIALSEADIASLAGYRAVAGHFTLGTLMQIAPSSRMATILREPRARLLSLYLYFRLDAPVRALWARFGSAVLSEAMRPLESFLRQRSIACGTDNQVCRMLLDGDDRIPERDFIDPADLDEVAQAALERLDRFGFVGIMESADAMWGGLSRMFGTPLDPVSVNVTGAREIDSAGLPVPPPEPEAMMDLIERRSAADRIVYETVLAEWCGSRDEARRQSDRAFAAQIERFGGSTGESITHLVDAAIARTRDA